LAAKSKIELPCTHHTVIIRNESLEDKHTGGLVAFRKKYQVNCNDHITVFSEISSSIEKTIKGLETIGLEQGKDFVALDTVECEMWRMIHSEKVRRPFWFETGADWLQCNHWNGKVVVWYDG
jgi:hypothetical protein